jgi:hypothetical protein
VEAFRRCSRRQDVPFSRFRGSRPISAASTPPGGRYLRSDRPRLPTPVVAGRCDPLPGSPVKAASMDRGINVIALAKDGERFVFLYDDDSGPQLLQTLGRYAADPELNFSWYDAAVLSQKVRRLQQETVEESPRRYFRESA